MTGTRASEITRRAGAALRGWAIRFWPALLGAVLFLLFALIETPPGALYHGTRWHGWWDQAYYYRSTLAFAHGDLSADAHWYPLLYPLAAVPWLPLFPDNPYLPLDLICAGASAQAVVSIGRRLGVVAPVAFALFVATSFLPPMQESWFRPWTSTLSTALILTLIARAGELMVPPGEAPTARRLVALGALAALVALARPADAAVPFAIGMGLLLSIRLERRALAAAAIGAGVPLLLYGALHLAIYGPRASDYMRLQAAIGANFADLGWRATTLFLDPAPWFPGSAGLLRALPWVVIGLAGALFLIGAPSERPARRFVAAIAVAMAACCCVLAAYVELLPTGLWRYDNIHYFKWMLPLLALFGWALATRGIQAPRTAIAAIAAVLLVTGFHFDAVPARPAEAARRIDFAPPAGATWGSVYFASSAIRDGGAVRRNIYGYRQIAAGPAVRAIALRGDFAPDARWLGVAPADTEWPRGTPGFGTQSPLAGSWPQAPVARWKARLGWAPLWWLFAPLDRFAPPR